jgi:hypothetical protein
MRITEIIVVLYQLYQLYHYYINYITIMSVDFFMEFKCENYYYYDTYTYYHILYELNQL